MARPTTDKYSRSSRKRSTHKESTRSPSSYWSPVSSSPVARGLAVVYKPLGFTKAYNFVLFFIFGGAILGFSIARLSYLNLGGGAATSFRNGAQPGEWYAYRSGMYRVGLLLHLSTCLPVGLLMVWQFVPVIRHRFLLFHRINGYAVILLTLASNAGAIIIAPRAFGGGLDTQSAVGLTVILTTLSLVMAYINIKRLQIDQHRAWMLRAMFYMGNIITMRIIMVMAAAIISKIGGYYLVVHCRKLAFVHSDGGSDDLKNDEYFAVTYPQCIGLAPGQDPVVPVEANMMSGYQEGIMTSLNVAFGWSAWLALFLHLIGVEIYLNLTRTEGERLRNVSYGRQLEAGYNRPGSAGLTADKFGDNPEWEHSPSCEQ